MDGMGWDGMVSPPLKICGHFVSWVLTKDSWAHCLTLISYTIWWICSTGLAVPSITPCRLSATLASDTTLIWHYQICSACNTEFCSLCGLDQHSSQALNIFTKSYFHNCAGCMMKMSGWGACPPFRQSDQPNTPTQATGDFNMFQNVRIGGLPPILTFWPARHPLQKKHPFWGGKTQKKVGQIFFAAL